MKIYLISGESYLLINEKINEIVKSNSNITTFDLTNNSLDEVLIEAGYTSMFGEEKYIVIKNANYFGSGKLNEKDTNTLINYLENPSSSSTLIFVLNQKLDLRKKITKLIKEKYTVIAIPNLKVYEIENRISNFFQKRNFKIDNESIKYIVENSLNNYDIAIKEAEKVILYYKEAQYISFSDLKNIVAKPINSNNFLFVDSIVDGNLEKSFELLHDLKTLKVEENILIALISRDFRIMLHIKELLNQNKREYEIMNELSLVDWQFDKYLKKAFPYKEEELKSIILKLAQLDLDLKSGKIDKNLALELFILDICDN